MSNFGNDIRKISRYDELIKKIREAQDTADQAKKLAIGGARSTTYISAQGAVSEAVAGAIGVTNPTNNGVTTGNGISDEGLAEGLQSAIDAAGANIANGGSGGASSSGAGDTEGNNGDNSSRDGWYDAQSVLNGAVDELGKASPAPGTGLAVNTLTGLQTDAGRQVLVHLRDAAVSFIGPDDAVSASSGTSDALWQAGFYWLDAFGAMSGPQGHTAIYQQRAKEFYPDLIDNSISYEVSGVEPDGSVSGYFAKASNGAIIGSVNRSTCPGPAGVCTSAAPGGAPWNDMGYTQLAWATQLSTLSNLAIPAYLVGRFVPNPFDVNVPSDYAQGASILDLSTLGGQKVRIGPLANGGFFMYSRDPANNNQPVANSTAVLFDGDRSINSYIPANNVQYYLPR